MVNNTISVEEYNAARQKARRKASGSKRPKVKRAPAAKTDLFTAIARDELGVEVVKELEFCAGRRWRFDYAIPEYKIALEVEGGAFKKRRYIDAEGDLVTTIGGRHNSAKGFLADMEKYNTATVLGWRVLRTIPDALLSGDTLDMIRETIRINYGKK